MSLLMFIIYVENIGFPIRLREWGVTPVTLVTTGMEPQQPKDGDNVEQQLAQATMIIAPSYTKIKIRAVELLTSPAGFNGYAAAEIRSVSACGRYRFHNNIRAALCMARDEIDPATSSRRSQFNVGNFNKAAREIAREIQGPEPVRRRQRRRKK
jgi:hypothetical protein